MLDVRQEILKSVKFKTATASITADSPGIVAGIAAAKTEIDRLGLSVLNIVAEGAPVQKDNEILRVKGAPEQIVKAEEVLIGLLAKPSGIATSANNFVKATCGRPRIVSGAWKKMPPSLKSMVREAIAAGGASFRIVSEPFLYLDKNYIKLLGGIKMCLTAMSHMNGHLKVVQVKGKHRDVISEACEAAQFGADVVFIDTGETNDIQPVIDNLLRLGLRDGVKLAFAGGVTMGDIENLKPLDIDILDIGKQIVDAPLLDMKFDILSLDAAGEA